MKLKLKRKTDKSVTSRLKRKVRIRKKIVGSNDRPRLVVFRSSKNIYAQIVDDNAGKTIVSSSSLTAAKDKSGKEAAKLVGADLGKQAVGKNIKSVVFDRSGYAYHGRIQVLADAAREAGLSF
ncbi:MAG: 50S ribosomal protein L18 [Proteobacteria bacterium SG_bin7]|nr:MAG: 50S ribosomal protein L18 [Proteobacteria bacterium SG_bin7]